MAGRPLNRRGLRRQAELAEQTRPDTPLLEDAGARKPAKAAGPARKPSARKPRAPKAVPRMRARWCIYDGNMKPVALYPYNQRAAADARLADLLARAKGVHFLRLFKDAIPEPPAAGAAD